MNSIPDRNQPVPRKRSKRRRVFSSEARYAYGSFAAANGVQQSLDAKDAIQRNEQWIYL
ncbi:hypothetical protein [Glutamicibacter sp.]|uniref:hypothetical protein n=1 Tax=Glutamicibacter sp. TaxID=1931995 RepID=UPI003D6B824D